MENKVALKRDLANLIQKQQEYQELSSTLQQMREDKNELEGKIISFLKDMEWNDKVFVFNDHQITQRSTWQYQQLSLKYMEESLRTYIAHKNISFDSIEIISRTSKKKISISKINGLSKSFDIDEFLGFLKQNRSRKQKEELKIS